MKTHRAIVSLTGLSILAFVAACGSSDSSEPSGGGGDNGKGVLAPTLGPKADQESLPIKEAGRFLEDGMRLGAFDGESFPAFRVASFGNTKIRVALNAVDDAFDTVVLIQGPVPSANPKIIAFNDDANAATLNSELEVTLEEAGAYRVVVGSYESFANQPVVTGDYQLSFSCLENCTLPQISLAELVAQLKADYGEPAAKNLLMQKASALFQDPELAAAIRVQAESLLAGVGSTDAFPVIPLAAMPAAQGFSEVVVDSSNAPPPPEPVTFVLEDMLQEPCSPARGEAEQLVPEVPELKREWATDYRFDDCSLQRAQQLAEVLNNLALDNGSAVVANGERHETVEAAIRALVKAGHRIEARNNRYYANFLGLTFKGASVSAPLWVDTGIPLPSGGTLKIPASHAHYHFVIEGPLMNAELSLYMGIPAGTAFRAEHIYRPAWAGERTTVTRNTEQDLETVVSLFAVGGKLRKKWFTSGAAYPERGYGKLGVCLDSTAVLEVATENTVSLFPLLHPEPSGAPQDEIDSLLAKLPSEIAGTGNDTAMDRIIASQPFDATRGVDLNTMPFPTLKAELEDLGIAR